MLIARSKRRENIAEYLIYMWQIEDIIRANSLDINSIQRNIIDQFDQPDAVKLEMKEWYESLIDMMKSENISDSGHLQINKNTLSELSALHNVILNNPQESDYIATYYRTLPFIVELRAKNNEKDTPELETCFSALYGYLMLRLQNKEVSGDTQAAIAQISSLLRRLSERYKLENSND